MQRRLLAALLANANECVALEELMSALWGMDCPPAARKTIQVYVRRLRIALGEQTRIAHEPAGYRIIAAPGELDAAEFAQLMPQGRLREALGLWRGRAFEDVREFPPVSDAAQRLDEERLRVEAAHIAAELEAGKHHELIPQLRALTDAHPHREDLRGHLMLALYRAGRQAEALEIYLSTRTLLADARGPSREPSPISPPVHISHWRYGSRRPTSMIIRTGPSPLTSRRSWAVGTGSAPSPSRTTRRPPSRRPSTSPIRTSSLTSGGPFASSASSRDRTSPPSRSPCWPTSRSRLRNAT